MPKPSNAFVVLISLRDSYRVNSRVFFAKNVIFCKFIVNAVEKYACISLWEEKYRHDFMEIIIYDTVLEIVIEREI